MLRIVLHPAAAREVREAEGHYAAVHPELGAAFMTALDRVLERAQRLPKSGRAWRRSDPGRRVYVVSGFPYLVIARIRPSELRIISVAHQRRRPGYWLERER
jgi:plasmid stabilization system protein ParE